MTETLSSWVGRKTESADLIDPARIGLIAATLDRDALLEPANGEPLPPCWHWAFFNTVALQSVLGRDGHPPRGAFLPPVSLPRRMWAGSRLRWHGAFKVGARVRKRSTILSVRETTGRTGDMVFVTVAHDYDDGAGPILTEEQDIVYRPDPGPDERAALAQTGAQARSNAAVAFEHAGSARKRIEAGPVMLFRYSAATFNGHRIHYDRDYCTGVEGYPGLVVHGPLIATLLLDWSVFELHPGRRVAAFEFSARRPTFDIAPFHLHAQTGGEGPLPMWSSDNLGRDAVKATLTWAD